MNEIRVYRAADQLRMPWKNGAGTTVEVAREDDPETGALLWRLSIADVATDGPFSTFDGYRRIISVLDGDGMILTVDGVRSPPLLTHDTFAFDGAARTTCELLGGPIRDFNVIYAADRVAGRMRWVTFRGAESLAASGETLLILNAGETTVWVDLDAGPLQLDPGDCVRLERGGRVQLRAPGANEAVCAVIELSAPGSSVVE